MTNDNELDAPQRVGLPSFLRRSLLITGALVLAVVVAWAAITIAAPHRFSGTVLQAPDPAPSMLGLTRDDGSALDLASFQGEVLLVYFGYLSCPDACPTTLSNVASARRRLGSAGDRVRLLMISVDPERDSLAEIGDYVRSFDEGFVGATGDHAALDRVAAQYGIFFARGADLGSEYAVDHTATLMGIDTDGHLRIIWPAGIDIDRLVADLEELL